jgi:hypothetical protein
VGNKDGHHVLVARFVLELHRFNIMPLIIDNWYAPAIAKKRKRMRNY